MPTIPAGDLFEALENKGATELFHSNTVRTSLAFIQHAAGLLSRGAMELAGHPQTPQTSDDKDKSLGIWDYVFIDALDIHDRLKRRNFYGPVMFVYDLKVLLSAQILGVAVTRSNPVHWTKGKREGERWYSLEELKRRFVPRESYNSSLVLKCKDGLLPFRDGLKRIVLDDPKVMLPETTFTAYDFAERQLVLGASEIIPRVCPPVCGCVNDYKSLAKQSKAKFHKMFDPYGSSTKNPIVNKGLVP